MRKLTRKIIPVLLCLSLFVVMATFGNIASTKKIPFQTTPHQLADELLLPLFQRLL